MKNNKKIYLGAAMRCRYQNDGSIQQQIECNYEETCNAITTVTTKDCLVIEIETEDIDGE